MKQMIHHSQSTDFMFIRLTYYIYLKDICLPISCTIILSSSQNNNKTRKQNKTPRDNTSPPTSIYSHSATLDFCLPLLQHLQEEPALQELLENQKGMGQLDLRGKVFHRTRPAMEKVLKSFKGRALECLHPT